MLNVDVERVNHLGTCDCAPHVRKATSSLLAIISEDMSLHRRLPVDAIHDIFALCIQPDVSESRHEFWEFKPKLSSYPFLFTSICKEWTEIALAYPKLWSTIFVFLERHIPGDERFRPVPPEPIIERWLERSGSASLTLSLHSTSSRDRNRDYSAGSFYEASVHIIATHFTPHHSRWRKVVLEVVPGYLPGSSLACPMACLEGKTFPRLEHLTLLGRGAVYASTEFIQSVASVISASPRFNALAVDCNRVSWDQQQILEGAISWATLKHLKVLMPGDQVWRILSERARRLESLECGSHPIIPWYQRLSESGAVYTAVRMRLARHDYLQSLKITMEEVTPALLASLTLPRLRSFAMTCFHSKDQPERCGEVAKAFGALAERSGCRIRELRLEENCDMIMRDKGQTMTSPWVLHMIRAVSASLETLHVDEDDIKALIRCLTLPEGPLTTRTVTRGASAHEFPASMRDDDPGPVLDEVSHNTSTETPSKSSINSTGDKLLCPLLTSLSLTFTRQTCLLTKTTAISGSIAAMVASRWSPHSDSGVAKLQQFKAVMKDAPTEGEWNARYPWFLKEDIEGLGGLVDTMVRRRVLSISRECMHLGDTMMRRSIFGRRMHLGAHNWSYITRRPSSVYVYSGDGHEPFGSEDFDDD